MTNTKKNPSMLTRELLYSEYHDNKRSTTDIAEEYNTNPKRISRLLKKFEIPTRSRSEAQKLVAKEIHPTRGRERTEEEKIAISKGGANSWNKERRKKASSVGKKLWKKKSEKEKTEMQRKAAQALRVAAEEGSRLEKHFIEFLKDRGYHVLHHKMPISDRFLEVDLWITNKDVVIEIDGIRHIKPIHGDEDFKRRKKADERKNHLLTSAGFAVIRFIVIKKRISQHDIRELEKKVVELIETAKKGQVTEWTYE